MNRSRPLILLVAAAAFAGCAKNAPPPLPVLPLVDADQTLATLRDRIAAVQSLTGKGEVQLSSSTRGDVTLESVYVLRPPGDARVRAWKFNQAVFDLTATGDGVWIYSPREASAPGEVPPSAKALGDSVRQWVALLLGGIESPDAVHRLTGDDLIVTRPAAGGGMLRIVIDRPTRTVREQSISDPDGRRRFTLLLTDYQLFGDLPWPTRIVARSETGTITVRTRAITFNDAPATAFKPSSRATRLP